MQRSQNNKLLTIPKSSDFRNLSPTLSKGEGEIILSFQNIPSILNFPIIPITLITQITQNFPTILIKREFPTIKCYFLLKLLGVKQN